MTKVCEIFEPVLAKIRNWNSVPEMIAISSQAMKALCRFLEEFKHLQTPLLMQPIWKTLGKSPVLTENCLDIFVWSDFALTHLFLESALDALNGKVISRHLRAALRLSRFIYQSSMNTAVYQAPIYDGMTYDKQNDKEFSITGLKSKRLMSCERLLHPIVTKSEIKNIVLGGGQKYLSPERRFDAILYFSNELFDE